MRLYSATDGPADDVPPGFERISLVQFCNSDVVCYQVEDSDGGLYLCDSDGDKINANADWVWLRALADVPADDSDAFFEAVRATAVDVQEGE